MVDSNGDKLNFGAEMIKNTEFFKYEDDSYHPKVDQQNVLLLGKWALLESIGVNGTIMEVIKGKYFYRYKQIQKRIPEHRWPKVWNWIRST